MSWERLTDTLMYVCAERERDYAFRYHRGMSIQLKGSRMSLEILMQIFFTSNLTPGFQCPG